MEQSVPPDPGESLPDSSQQPRNETLLPRTPARPHAKPVPTVPRSDSPRSQSSDTADAQKRTPAESEGEKVSAAQTTRQDPADQPRINEAAVRDTCAQAHKEWERLNRNGRRLYAGRLALMWLGFLAAAAATVTTALLPNGVNRVVGAVLAAFATASAGMSSFLTARRAARNFERAQDWRDLRDELQLFEGYWKDWSAIEAWKAFEGFRARARALYEAEHRAMAEEDDARASATGA